MAEQFHQQQLEKEIRSNSFTLNEIQMKSQTNNKIGNTKYCNSERQDLIQIRYRWIRSNKIEKTEII